MKLFFHFLSQAAKMQMKYPRPMSEPPSPLSSRASTPAPSEHGSDEEASDDEHTSAANPEQ